MITHKDLALMTAEKPAIIAGPFTVWCDACRHESPLMYTVETGPLGTLNRNVFSLSAYELSFMLREFYA